MSCTRAAMCWSVFLSLYIKTTHFTGQRSGKLAPWRDLQLPQWQSEVATAVPAVHLMPSTAA